MIPRFEKPELQTFDRRLRNAPAARLVVCSVFLCLCFFTAIASAQEKIDIAELLQPETRQRALRDFLLRQNPKFGDLGWDDLAKFQEAYSDVQVLVSTRPPIKEPVYVVTSTAFWAQHDELLLDPGAYPTTNFDRLFPPPGPISARSPARHIQYYLFDSKGSFIKPDECDGYIGEGFVLDLNGDGTIEVLEKQSSESVQYLTVREMFGTAPFFALAYDWRDNEHRIPPRAFAVNDADGDGIYDLVLGPNTPGTTAEVTFRWDAQKRTWTGPAEDDHFRVLNPKNVRAEIAQLAANREHTKPETVDEKPEISITQLPPSAVSTGDEFERLPADEISKPYRYESLSKFSNEELLAWMGDGRTMWDLQRERIPPALPPDFWTADPKAAALRFVERNRPPDAEANFRLALDDLDGERPPEEGTLTVSDGPSGCFSPGGAYEYFLRCSREGSYLVVARRLSPWHDVDPLEENTACDLRKVSLAYEEARHVVQVAWWLDRVRSKKVGEQSGGGGIGSTSDGRASFRLEWPRKSIEFEGTRFAGHSGRPVGVGEMDDQYTRTACLNLVVVLVCQELPAFLGERWTRMDVHPRQPLYDIPSLRTDYTPEARERLKATVAEFVQLFLAGGLSVEATREAVEAAGALVLLDLRPDLEKVAASLPKPSAREMRLGEIAAEIAECCKRLGPEGTRWIDAFHRRNPSLASSDLLAIPGIGAEPAPLGGAEKAEPKPAPPDPKFAPLDALYAEQDRLNDEQPLREKAVAALRARIVSVLHWFAIRDDAPQLYELATSNQFQLFPACRRLRELDPPRALAALEYWAKQEKNPSAVQPLLKAMDDIRAGLTPASAKGPAAKAVLLRLARLPADSTIAAQAAGLMTVALDPERDIQQRLEAVHLLVPAEQPWRFPDPAIDDFLVRVTESEDSNTSYLWTDVCRALAMRGGGKHWERIVTRAKESNFIGMPRLTDLLPSLAVIAIKEPEPYRKKLREILAPQFTKTYGALDCILWTAWMTDQRELKPTIEKLATSSPQDVEGSLASSQSNHPSAVRHRFHAARQVASLWNEEDAAARAKLLIAVGLKQQETFGENPGRERLRKEFQRAARELDAEQHARVAAFVEWCARARADAGYGGPKARAEGDRWLSEARAFLGR